MQHISDWDVIKSLWTSRDILAIVVVLVIVFFGREFQLRVMTRVKSRSKWAQQWGEPILTPYEAKVGLSVLLGVLMIAGVAMLLMEAACPFRME